MFAFIIKLHSGLHKKEQSLLNSSGEENFSKNDYEIYHHTIDHRAADQKSAGIVVFVFVAFVLSF